MPKLYRTGPNKSNIENEGNTKCRNSTEQDQSKENPKSKRDLAMILGDSQTHKRMGNSEKSKTRMQIFCEKLPRRNYSMNG